MIQQNKNSYAYFGGGCFWCIEAVFTGLDGVSEVTSGYSGDTLETANYKDVCSGNTKHAEICKIQYNPHIISFDILLEVFFLAHDPTTLNQQGNDYGTQYRSIIFYVNSDEKHQTETYIRQLESTEVYKNIITELNPLENFYPAEEYHQNYFQLNPKKTYCKFIINPKIQKLREKLKKYYLGQ